MFQIIFYTTDRDDSPIDTFLDELDKKSRAKVDAYLYRILYFFYLRDHIVLIHGFSKKSQQIKERDIELAERRMEDWIRRNPSGG